MRVSFPWDAANAHVLHQVIAYEHACVSCAACRATQEHGLKGGRLPGLAARVFGPRRLRFGVKTLNPKP